MKFLRKFCNYYARFLTKLIVNLEKFLLRKMHLTKIIIYKLISYSVCLLLRLGV